MLPPEDSREPVVQQMRRGHDPRTIVAVLAALAFVAIALVKPWGAQQRPGQSAAATTAGATTAGGTNGAPVAVATRQPLVNDPTKDCLENRVVVITAGLTPLPDLPPVSIPENRKVAYVVAEHGSDPSNDQLLVVVATSAGSRVAALVSSQAGVRDGFADVRGWTADGSYLLVEAGRRDPSPEAIDRSCSDLYLVGTDGTEVDGVTYGLPGQMSGGGTLVQGDRSVALAQLTASKTAQGGIGYQVNLRVISVDGTLARNGAPCDLASGAMASGRPYDLLAASTDGSRLAVVCDQGVQTTDLGSIQPKLIPGSRVGLRAAVGWSSDGQRVVTVVDPIAAGPRSLLIESAGWRGTAASSKESSIADWVTSPGAVSFSPDGTRVVAEACASSAPDDCERLFEVVDVATGETHVVCYAPNWPADLNARWLPDGKQIAVGQDGIAGSMVCPADGSGKVQRSNLPPDAAWWPNA